MCRRPLEKEPPERDVHSLFCDWLLDRVTNEKEDADGVRGRIHKAYETFKAVYGTTNAPDGAPSGARPRA